MCSWGARAGGPGSSLLWFHPNDCACRTHPTPTPKFQAPAGGLKALTGILGRPQDSHLPLCSGWLHPGAHSATLSSGPRIGTEEEVYRARKRPFGTFPAVQTFLNPTLHPSPRQNPNMPGPSAQPFFLGCRCSCGPGPHGPDLQMVVKETPLGHPIHPPDRGGQQRWRP